MITVIGRPLGHKLTDAELDATVTSDAGTALFNTLFAHGLQDGDYVYVQGNIEAYNGFKYVDSIAYNSFQLRESETGAFVVFKQSASVTYRISVLQHGWLAITQPIVYELQSDLWPINEPEDSYTARVVDSSANAEGYTQLNLSSALNSPFELDFIELVGTGSLAGVYQILEVLQPWSVIINLAYSASNSFLGYTVVKYYNNYCINVDVYSGLGVEHPWYSEKPYELAATLRFTPDNNGKCKFSISDILKGYIETRNNLTLNTLPNNLDFMTGFYIAYYESYDESDGDEITTFQSDITSDYGSFEGHAVNSDMPFKSTYVSHMSEYLSEDTYLAKWLILQVRPIIVVGYFFDLSFINALVGINLKLNINKSLNGVVLETELTELNDIGVGVIRVPIEAEAGFDEYCIKVYKDAIAGYTPAALADFLTWSNVNDAGPAWAVVSTWVEVNTNAIGLNTTSDKWYTPYSFEASKEYSFDYTFNTNGMTFTISVLNGAMAVLTSVSVVIIGVTSGTYAFIAPAGASGISVHIFQAPSCGSIFDGCKAYILAFDNSTPSTPSIPQEDVTETICMEVISQCDSTFIPDDDIRLTEDGDFRILE